jgi:AhpD family alkylhydroperoxidase
MSNPVEIKPRMKSPVMVLPDVLQTLMALGKSARQIDVQRTTLGLVHLRASQINGCSFCVNLHARELKEAGESDLRIFAVAAWREAPYFTEPERAALALTEAATRLNDRSDPVPDEVWEEASRHYSEQALAGLVLNIAMINFWNRINVTTRQPAGPLPH